MPVRLRGAAATPLLLRAARAALAETLSAVGLAAAPSVGAAESDASDAPGAEGASGRGVMLRVEPTGAAAAGRRDSGKIEG